MQAYTVPQVLVRESPLVVHSALLSDTTTNQTSEFATTIGSSASCEPCKERLTFGLKLRGVPFERHDDARVV